MNAPLKIPAAALTPEDHAAVARYVAAMKKRERLDAAEGRTFAAYMSEPTRSRASTARKAKSRTDAHGYECVWAESAIFSIIDRLVDDHVLPGTYHCDPARFCQEVSA